MCSDHNEPEFDHYIGQELCFILMDVTPDFSVWCDNQRDLL
jgi:hypothetical protein